MVRGSGSASTRLVGLLHFALDLFFALHDGLTSLTRPETVVRAYLLDLSCVSFGRVRSNIDHRLRGDGIFSEIIVFLPSKIKQYSIRHERRL